MKSYYVYILATRKQGTLYIGVSGNLARRMWQHRSDVVDGFTNRYKVHRLVYMEEFQEPEQGNRPRKIAQEMAARVED